jgi:hypothetical protein
VEGLSGAVAGARSAPCASVAGGGALPGVEVPSWGVTVPGDHAAALRRAGPRPVIARVRAGETTLDLRTVDEADDPALHAALLTATP